MKAVAENRHEIWVSMAAVVGAVSFQVVPIDFFGALVLGGGMVIGLLCAINAFLDRDAMGVIETYVAGFWLLVLIVITPLTVYWIATIREFARM